jgi:hypothetical protein
MPRIVRIIAAISVAAAAFALAAPESQATVGSGTFTTRTSLTEIGWGAATNAAGTMPMPPGQPTGIGWD